MDENAYSWTFTLPPTSPSTKTPTKTATSDCGQHRDQKETSMITAAGSDVVIASLPPVVQRPVIDDSQTRAEEYSDSETSYGGSVMEGNESWWSAIFSRPFRSGMLWVLALVPLVFASVATCIGMVLGSNINSFTVTGLMNVMVYVAPTVANGLVFTSDAGTDSLNISGWWVLVYLAMAAGFGLVGWWLHDRRNIAGMAIPVGVYLVVQLWLMAGLTPSAVMFGRMSQDTPQPVATDAWSAAMADFDRSLNDLGTAIMATQTIALRWGPAFWMILVMVGLTALMALVFLTWWQKRTGSAFGNLQTAAYVSDGGLVSVNAEEAVVYYCPACGWKTRKTAEGHQCIRKGCGTVVENFGVHPNKRCEYCNELLRVSSHRVTWNCCACGARQSIGHGGPWTNSALEGGDQVGV